MRTLHSKTCAAMLVSDLTLTPGGSLRKLKPRLSAAIAVVWPSGHAQAVAAKFPPFPFTSYTS